MDNDLSKLTLLFDSLSDKIESLEAEKKEVREKMIGSFNELIRLKYPGMENPEDQGYAYVNPVNGKVYKKSIAEVGTKFNDQGFLHSHPDLEHMMDISYKLNERRAKNYISVHPEFEKTLQEYVIPGKTQVRVYRGVEPKEEDL